jgi:hypothetical protein
MLGSLVPALRFGFLDRRRHARHTTPTLKVRINGKSYRTKNWSLTGFRLDDFDGVCAWGEQIRGIILFKGGRGEVLAERCGSGRAKRSGSGSSRSIPTSSSGCARTAEPEILRQSCNPPPGPARLAVGR